MRLLLAPAAFAALLLAGAGAGAETLVLGAVADATIGDTNGDGAFETITNGLSSLVVRSFQDYVPGSSDFEDRAVLEFDLSGIAAGAVIESVTFDFYATSATGNAGRIVGVYVYAGDGLLGLGDATASGVQAASYDNFAEGTGPVSLSLTAGAIQALVGSGSALGLRLQGNELTANTSIASTELGAIAFAPPTVTIRYRSAAAAVPEPASLAMAGLGILGVAGLAINRKRMS